MRTEPADALNNVLDLARIENDKTEMEYSVSDIDKDFRNCIAMFRNLADSKGQTLMVTTQLLHPYIYADIPHLTEVCTTSSATRSNTREPAARSAAMLRRSPAKKRAGAIW